MRNKRDTIIDVLCVAIPGFLFVAFIFAIVGGLIYVGENEETVIMHSDTGDYACTVSPLSHGPTSCKPIEGMK